MNTTQLRRFIFAICRRAAGAALALVIALVLAVVVTGSAQAQDYIYSVLYSFTGGADGGYRQGTLVLDAQGNLYGTTTGGGAYSDGTVFKVDTTGKETVLYSFGSITGDGANPIGGVVLDAQGSLYGTTFGGGAFGAGTVFKLDTTGKETVLYSFTGSPDGANPYAGVVRDAEGNLYGTTLWGGDAYGDGTVFKVDTSGNESVLHSFGSRFDGCSPYAGLVMDGQGNLFGTTFLCGTKNGGTVFEVDTTGTETVLYSFGSGPKGNGPDGDNPFGTLVLDGSGYLWGTTQWGGKNNKGTAFFMVAGGGYPEEEVFYDFGKGGIYPYAGLALDSGSGNLYGTAAGYRRNLGTVFELDPYGDEWVLHSFRGSKKGDGASPYGGLALEPQGGWNNLYGTTTVGGPYDWGTVFALLNSAAATTTTLTSAPNPSKVGQPVTFTAAVSGPAGAPPDGETVKFMNLKVLLGTGTLSGGSASFTTSTLKKGIKPVTAVYGGDTLFPGSTSNVVKQVVAK